MTDTKTTRTATAAFHLEYRCRIDKYASPLSTLCISADPFWLTDHRPDFEGSIHLGYKEARARGYTAAPASENALPICENECRTRIRTFILMRAMRGPAAARVRPISSRCQAPAAHSNRRVGAGDHRQGVRRTLVLRATSRRADSAVRTCDRALGRTRSSRDNLNKLIAALRRALGMRRPASSRCRDAATRWWRTFVWRRSHHLPHAARPFRSPP